MPCLSGFISAILASDRIADAAASYGCPATLTGTLLLDVVPSPSWPWLLSPQQ
jgi:hypothetical protein